MTLLISDDKAEKALAYLASTDSSYAQLKGGVAETEYLARLCESKQFLTAEGSSVEERKAKSKIHPETMAAWDRHHEMLVEYEYCRAKRERAAITLELFRTVSANRRVGSI